MKLGYRWDDSGGFFPMPPLPLLLYRFCGMEALIMFEKIRSQKSPVECDDVCFLLEQIENIDGIIERTIEQRKGLLRIIERTKEQRKELLIMLEKRMSPSC